MKPQLDALRNFTPAQLQAEIAYGEKMLAERHLYNFVKLMWSAVEPAREFIEGWAIGAICEHLQAITDGQIKRLIINVPPGFSKSLCTSVFWPAWEWGPRNLPSMRYVCASYSSDLTIRDNIRARQIIMSGLYQQHWGGKFKPAEDQFSKIKFANDKTGWKLATSVSGIGTGERADRFMMDDPNSVKEAESAAVLASTNMWALEVVPTRLNDPDESAIVLIQQRTNDADVTGTYLTRDLGYEHLMIPMEFDPFRRCQTSIGWIDPREEDGELAWPERFPLHVVEDLKKAMGSYATSGQFQQSPEPRGGGIFKRDWWQAYPPEGEQFDTNGKSLKPLSFPPMEYICAAVDTAFTTKAENDYSACVVMGIFKDRNNVPRVMLMDAWQVRLEFHDLVEKMIKTCKVRKVDRLLIESKANGISVAQEIVRLCSGNEFGVQLVDPKGGDKVARAYAIQHLFEGASVFAPDRTYAQMVIDELAVFPRGAHDDLTDAVTLCLKHLRETGTIMTGEEYATQKDDLLLYRSRKAGNTVARSYEV